MKYLVLEATQAPNISGQGLAGPVPYLLEYWMIWWYYFTNHSIEIWVKYRIHVFEVMVKLFKNEVTHLVSVISHMFSTVY